MANTLISRLGRLFRTSTAADLAVAVGTDDQALPAPGKTTEKDEKVDRRRQFMGELYTDRDRIRAYADYRMIDVNIPELSRALTIIATNATAGDRGGKSGFKLDFASEFEDENHQIISGPGGLMDRTSMQSKVYGIIRSNNKMGDYFAEPAVDSNGLIWRLKYLMPEFTTRVHDEYDRHLGFEYKGYDKEAQKLDWWQVIHLRHDHEEGYAYGRSLFAGGGRGTAHRLAALRDALMLEALNHASSRHAFAVGYPIRMGEGDRDDWIDDLREEISREPVVEDNNGTANLYRRAVAALTQSNMLIPYPVDIDGRSHPPTVHALKNAPIGDLRGLAEHFQDLCFVITGVPKAFFGVERAGEGMGSTRLDKQDIQFARQLRRDQEEAAWFVIEVIRRQFVFLRRRLMAGMVEIKMPDLREVDRKLRAEIMKLQMEAVKIAIESGLPPRYVWLEIIFDGNYDAAAQAESLLQLDFDKEFVTAQEKTAISNRGAAEGKPPNTKQLDDLKERGHLVAEMLDAERPVTLKNEEVT